MVVPNTIETPTPPSSGSAVTPNRQLFVNIAGWSFGADPSKFFTSISAAIAVANALVPAPDVANPVLITINPGIYAESFTLSRPGIVLSANPQMRAHITQVNGDLTIDLPAAIDRDLNHVAVTGITFRSIIFTGANPQKAYLADVICQTGVGDALLMNNTGVDTGTRRSQIISQNLTLTCFAGAAFRCFRKTGGDFECFQGIWRKTPDTEIAVELAGVGVPGAGFCTFSNVDIDGRVVVSGNSPLTLIATDVSSASGAASAIESTSSGVIVAGGIAVGSIFTPAISVAGVFVSGDITFTSSSQTFTAGAYVPLTQFSPKFRYRRAVAASGAVTNTDDVIEGTGGGAGITLTLPTAASMNRRTLSIKKVDVGVGPVIVDAAGAETIDGALTQTLPDQWDSIDIYSNGVSWDILATVGIGGGAAATDPREFMRYSTIHNVGVTGGG